MDEAVNLYYQAGSSDKVYQVQLQDTGTGFVVNFQYGRPTSHDALAQQLQQELPSAVLPSAGAIAWSSTIPRQMDHPSASPP